MSTYFMPLFPIPKQVEDELDKIRRNLLWEGKNSSHKFHLVKWDKVIQPKSRRGLGIRDLGMHNKCILMKRLWRYAATDSTLWKEVIKVKHGVLDNWCSKIVNAPYGVGPWEYISKLGQEFSQNIHFKAGNWCTYYILEKQMVEQFITHGGVPHNFPDCSCQRRLHNDNRRGNSWDTHLRRAIQDWELGSLLDLLTRIEEYTIVENPPDILMGGTETTSQLKSVTSSLVCRIKILISDHGS
ncbi:hypothetical protein MTR67_036534 [Solanum verrucosum]|uniref:Uncharacterized protein n=1 Tax=Solanum verrucosum TaxID=315347 RepID=A0AAF0UC71_SOLVR|nr:hypothetical protein MTR67_036534 [Solanum verrucosum]